MTSVEILELKVAIANLELEIGKKSEELAKMKKDLFDAEKEVTTPVVKATFAAAAAAAAVTGEPEKCMDFPPIPDAQVVPEFPVLEIPEGSMTCHVDGCHHMVYPCHHPDGNPVLDKQGHRIVRMVKGKPVCSAHAPKCSNKECRVFKGGPAACRFDWNRKSFGKYCPHCA